MFPWYLTSGQFIDPDLQLFAVCAQRGCDHDKPSRSRHVRRTHNYPRATTAQAILRRRTIDHSISGTPILQSAESWLNNRLSNKDTFPNLQKKHGKSGSVTTRMMSVAAVRKNDGGTERGPQAWKNNVRH